MAIDTISDNTTGGVPVPQPDDDLRKGIAALHDDLRKLRQELHRLFEVLGIRLMQDDDTPYY